MRNHMLGVVLLATLLIGCGEAPPAPEAAAPAATNPPPPAPPTPNRAAEPTLPAEANSPAPAAEPQNLEKAEAGVGEKGRGYGGGPITEPARQRFLIEDRLNFTRMEHAMDLYKAQHGALPKTHDAFMREIIEANEINLPELPAGDEYWYDPQRGELMVRSEGGGRSAEGGR